MTQSWERVRGIPGREDHLPLRTEAWSSPFPPRVDDPDDERGNNPSSNATPDTQTVKARGSTKCRNGHGAHESGIKRAQNGAPPTRSRSAATAVHGAENWATGGGRLVRAPSHHRSPVSAVSPIGTGDFTCLTRLDDRDSTERKSQGSVSGKRPCVETSSIPKPLPLPEGSRERSLTNCG